MTTHKLSRAILLPAVASLALAGLASPVTAEEDPEPDSPAFGPAARCCVGMAYFPGTSRVILYGGLTSGGVVMSDTWAWNGTSWQRLIETSPPGPRSSNPDGV